MWVHITASGEDLLNAFKVDDLKAGCSTRMRSSVYRVPLHNSADLCQDSTAASQGYSHMAWLNQTDPAP